MWIAKSMFTNMEYCYGEQLTWLIFVFDSSDRKTDSFAHRKLQRCIKSSVTILEEFTYLKNIFLAKLLEFAVLKVIDFIPAMDSPFKSFW